jgi:hypothetical protein
MLDVLWATLALCALALTGGALALMLSQRKVVEKAAQSLDSLNKELPALLDSARLATLDAQELLSLLGTMGRTAAWAGGIFKGIRALAGTFGAGANHGHTKEVSHERP